MTIDRAEALAIAVEALGSKNDAHALTGARFIAQVIRAEAIKPKSVGAAMDAVITELTELKARSIAELGPRGMRKRLAELWRYGRLHEMDKTRVMEMRDRLAADGRLDLPAEDVTWLDSLWNAHRARAREAG